MERSGLQLAQDLRRWAAEEMKLPPDKIPSESVARRMCSGQCAEIWKYVIRHVHHQKNVKKIRGNLLWYQQVEEREGKPSSSESEKERRKQLVRGISRLRAELEQLDLQIESAQQELVADEVALETAQEKILDTKRRGLLLKVYSSRVAAERQKLHAKTVQIGGRLEQFENIERKARTAVVFGKNLEPGFLTLEPEVLRDVQEACQLRFELQKTLFEHSISGHFPSGLSEEQLKHSYQHWLGVVEKIAARHPPAHILLALEQLALRSTQKLQKLTDSINIPKDVEALKFRYDSAHLEDVSKPVDDLPSVQHFIREGWSKCEMLFVQQIPLRAQERSLLTQLEGVVQEVHRLLSDGSERSILARAVFELELRAVRLQGYRDGLLHGCRKLEEAVRIRHTELQGLQAKRQRIMDFRHLVNEKQQNIRTLITGTSYIKSQLRKNQAEVPYLVTSHLNLTLLQSHCHQPHDSPLPGRPQVQLVMLEAFQEIEAHVSMCLTFWRTCKTLQKATMEAVFHNSSAPSNKKENIGMREQLGKLNIQDFIERKLLPQQQWVELETQQLIDSVDRQVQQFGAISLPSLLRRQLPGSRWIPAHKLSIHRLSRTALLEYRALLNVCNAAAFPLYKAPEQLLFHTAELRKKLFYLRAQLSSKQRTLGSLLQQLDNDPEPDVQALVKKVQAHDQDQARELLPRIQRVADQCRCRIECWQEFQAVVDAWWEQPGQFVLPAERRHGLTLQQWLERWTLATKSLQQKQQKEQHSWA